MAVDGSLAARVPLSVITTLPYPLGGERGEVGNNGEVRKSELISDDVRVRGGCPNNWFGGEKQGRLSCRACSCPPPIRLPPQGQTLPRVLAAIECEGGCPRAKWPRVYVANRWWGTTLKCGQRLGTTLKCAQRRIEKLPAWHVSEASAYAPAGDDFAHPGCGSDRSFGRSTAGRRQLTKEANGRRPRDPFPSTIHSANHIEQRRHDRAFFIQRAASPSPPLSRSSHSSPSSYTSSPSSSSRCSASSSSSSSSASDNADAGADSTQSSPPDPFNGNRTYERGSERVSSPADWMQGVQPGREGSEGGGGGGGGEGIKRPDEKGGLGVTSQSEDVDRGKEQQVRKDDDVTSSSSSSSSFDGSCRSDVNASAMAAEQHHPRSVEEDRRSREKPSLAGGQSDNDGDGSLQEGSFTRRGRGRARGDSNNNSFNPSTTETRPSQGSAAAKVSPTRVVTWAGRLPSKRRAVLGSIIALSVAIGGNLAGITSAILSIDDDVARRLRLDTLFPVKGLRRCVDQSRGFEFVYPARWLGDQRLLYRAVERVDAVRSLDPPSLKDAERERRRRQKSRRDPVVAFGPPRGSGEENVSVVVSPVPMDFRLEQFGSPTSVGRRLLDRLVAIPRQQASSAEGGEGEGEGGGGGGGGEGGRQSMGRKEAELIYAGERVVGPRGTRGVRYYDLEYTVKTDQWFRHNRAVFACVDGRLYSLNAQTPQTSWPERSEVFETIARSFRVIPSSLS
ncbi:hypothetical protein CBR_g32304 [Chara braunii]|uniref:PsbP C-terminal domain-containing protein n=1 Tax=Chara braunii TaxID=69332 RepID=A0A388JND3_CHABU|nr:hypothetical protein CBR_g32304 [Chara braunii]|eukprot:GBG59291.1 hypothetical protein CBR_g32304 [Chara braunii]